MNASQQNLPATAANEVESLYNEAIDPSTSKKRLGEIWEATKSPRVRKAIASNPNSDSKVMRKAARLYIKEVVNNSSFEILNLFSEDREIKEIYDAYMDPQKSYPTGLIRLKSDKKSLIARSLLVSPYLKSPSILSEICSVLSSAEFKRELKDKEVKDNVTRIIKISLNVLKMPVLLFLYNNGVIDMSDMGVAVENRSYSSVVNSKGAYIKFLTACIKEEISSGGKYDLIYNFMQTHRPTNTQDLVKAVRSKEYLRTDDHIRLYAKLYRQFLDKDTSEARRSHQSAISKRGYSNIYTLDNNAHSLEMSNLIWAAISQRCIDSSRLEDLDLKNLYSLIKTAGFHEDYGPFKCHIKLPQLSYLSGRILICNKLLEIEDDRAFEFFMTCDILWSEWYARGHDDNIEKKVINRLDRINNERFERGESLHYTGSVLDCMPYILVTQRKGLNYDDLKYKIRVDR